ncbi:TIGR03086 family metal-binding protein [Rhodococcus sp. ARC_M6]|uniref:TIGR03086 family metal-binding protein n=1 Tax=Rhodococcus sp. ARC_M6 TaxID=2928852 RepID=UPI001FB408AF|nr:TIGR03086 family metal-binding protein [Rhodococcus sp. ARC_M6]MCJ0902814.1 TIGR03086 family metal-binding protein [Rhodococcus sp. ARC_M6]
MTSLAGLLDFSADHIRRHRREDSVISIITAPELIDPRPIYLGATAWVATLLRTVRADQLTLPTPCDEFDVLTLSAHLIGTVGRIIAIAELGSPDSVSPIASEHDADTFARLAEHAQRVWADDALLDQPVKAPWGESSGRFALWGYTNEVLVHGWDLAVAIGQPAEADPTLVESTAEVVRQLIPPASRVPGVPFSAVVEPRAEAGLTERLANWSGRSSRAWV